MENGPRTRSQHLVFYYWNWKFPHPVGAGRGLGHLTPSKGPNSGFGAPQQVKSTECCAETQHSFMASAPPSSEDGPRWPKIAKISNPKPLVFKIRESVGAPKKASSVVFSSCDRAPASPSSLCVQFAISTLVSPPSFSSIFGWSTTRFVHSYIPYRVQPNFRSLDLPRPHSYTPFHVYDFVDESQLQIAYTNGVRTAFILLRKVCLL